MKLNILGTEYAVVVKKYDEDEAFARLNIDGYCDGLIKKIVVCDMATYKGWEHEPAETIEAAQRETLRHEIVHAFFQRKRPCQQLLRHRRPVGQERGDGGLDRPPGPEDLQGLGRCGGALKEGCRCSRLMTS